MMDYIERYYRRVSDAFWPRFTRFTGWDPNPDQQFTILVAMIGAFFVVLLLVYLQHIARSARKHAQRDRSVDRYLQMRKIQSADDH